jgi:hypothetical protein
VDVTVTNPIGTSATSSADLFVYVAAGTTAPTVSGISPTAGPPAGGTLVTIVGTAFTGATAVDFGMAAATNVNVVNDTTITADSPMGAGTVDVTVTTLGGTSATSAADQFTYGPTVTSISPRSGPLIGGTEVTITGANLANATAIHFGSTPATSFINFGNQIFVLSPAGVTPGAVDVTVTTAGGTSATSAVDVFFYSALGAVAPRVSAVSPAFGPLGGGTAVTITGLGFDQTNPALVYFGTMAATSVTVTSTTTITAVSPAGTGTVNVSAITFGGTSAISAADQFTYTVDGPRVTSVQRFGVHAQPTFLVIAFDSALNPVPATKTSNYRLTGPNGGRINVSSATYNSTTHTVTLRPAQMLNIFKTYRLTINGTAPSGLTNSAGVLLDGAGTGQPGSSFVTSITSSNVAGNASQRPIAAIAKARAKTFVVHAKFSIHKHAK